ncbi:MAG: class I SAM-dependent methyltransferase [Bacteroidia bacterium]|nr:class I SAM-dependent methyltransferase [Bacteroidia bacterium]
MSLQKNIEEQYGKRLDKNDLYNSDYSRFSEGERSEKLKLLVKEFLNVTTNITVLEIGAGQGGNISLLKEIGFSDQTIFMNELLPERIAHIKKNYPGIKIFEGNALDINFDQKFDCIFQSTVFTSILNEHDRVKLANKMWKLLNHGGIILWYDFIYNNPGNADVKKVSVDEVKALFALATKTKIVKVTLAPPIGRRVGKLYNLFNVPFLRSHILGVFQKQ